MKDKIIEFRNNVNKEIRKEENRLSERLEILKTRAEKIDRCDLLGAVYQAKILENDLRKINNIYHHINELYRERDDIENLLKEMKED